ncbi:hypothetical protein IWZ01DRAFT_221056 [Phyllosticta capitalensis]
MHRRRRRQSNVVLSVCILHLPAIYATPSMKRAFLPPLWDFQLSRRGCCLPSSGSVGLSTVHLAGAAEPATTQVKTFLPRGRANPPNALSTDLDLFTPVGGSSSSPALIHGQPHGNQWLLAPCFLVTMISSTTNHNNTLRPGPLLQSQYACAPTTQCSWFG